MANVSNNKVFQNMKLFTILVEIVDILILNIYTWFSIMMLFNINRDHKGFYLAVNLAYILSVTIAPPNTFRKHINNMTILRRATGIWFFFTIFSIFLLLFLDYRNMYYWWQGLLYFGIYYVVLVFSQILIHAILRKLRRQSLYSTSIFLGNASALERLYIEMGTDPAQSYFVKGYFADAPSGTFPEEVPYLGSLNEAAEWLSHNDIDEVYCCLPPERSDFVNRAIDYCDSNVKRFYAVPIVLNATKRQMETVQMGDIPIMALRWMPLTSISNRIKKRLFDIVVSSLVLILIMPWVTAIVAIIMKLTMPGPIFFRQKRTGLDGKEFDCIKFRSMKVNAQADSLQATKDDPRKTKFGNIMRHYNIDELPQFWNVFKGDMSVVGPRPHMVKQTDEYSSLIPKYMVRHFAKPGITGWAQVTGFRGETSELWQMEGRVKKDIWYIEHWTIWLDIKIMWLTVKNVFVGDKNAY
ncbi:MAG: undecaprenyl-phosphate glucose phosphotransferase [Bacteroidaceae bacterium]|nr:undecaprenyl-phosphate glucose phosphotransferase [Bacteroidaceae bacterium]